MPELIPLENLPIDPAVLGLDGITFLEPGKSARGLWKPLLIEFEPGFPGHVELSEDKTVTAILRVGMYAAMSGHPNADAFVAEFNEYPEADVLFQATGVKRQRPIVPSDTLETFVTIDKLLGDRAEGHGIVLVRDQKVAAATIEFALFHLTAA